MSETKPTIDEAFLVALEEKARAATPGPYYLSADRFEAAKRLCPTEVATDAPDVGHHIARPFLSRDAAFIAAASPDVVLALVREVRVLKKAVEITNADLFNLAEKGAAFMGIPVPASLRFENGCERAYRDARTALGYPEEESR